MFVTQYGELGAELATYYGGGLEQAEEALEGYYQGKYQDELDYAIYLFDEFYLRDIPENIHAYIDYESFKRDIFIGDYFAIEVKGNCHVFACH